MEKKKKNLAFIKNILIIDFWALLLFLNEFVIVSQMIEKVNSDNLKNYIIALTLVFVIFSLGIAMNIRNLFYELKHKVSIKKNIISYIFQVFFISCAFIGLFEAGLDSATTTKQVRKVLDFIQGEAFKVKMKSFDIVINNEKEDYEIGDKIEYDLTYKPFFANSKEISYELDNEIVSIDLTNNTITCLSNGECNITFYSMDNKEVSTSLNIVIDTEILEKIDLGENKDIFLEPGESYELNPILYPSVFQGSKVEYSSTNNEIAMVDENGKITGLSSGHAEILCSCEGVTSKVYVCVDPVLDIKANVSKYTFLSTNKSYGSFNIKIDDLASFSASYIKLSYKSDNVKISKSTLNVSSKTYSFTISNKDPENKIEESFPLTISYVYPGGYTLSQTIQINILGGEDLKVSDIDLNGTQLSYDIDLYYDVNGYLVTQYYELPIKYNCPLTYKNQNISIAESATYAGDLDLSCTKYNKVVMEFKNQEDVKNEYFINFYPSKYIDESIQIAVRINKKTLSNTDSSFEMTYLYEKSEGKKNEVWPEYFTKALFETHIHHNPEFKYSGLKIIPVGKTLEYIDFKVNEFGVITEFKLKSLNRHKYAKECVLEFDICSLYDYNKDVNCPKKRYVINIVNEYDDLLVSINGSEYHGDDFEINILKGETVKVSIEYPVTLEYKGNFQNGISFWRSSLYKVSSAGDKNILSRVTYESIVTKDYGITEIGYTFSGYYLNNKHAIKIKVNVVDENGLIPIKKKIDVLVTSTDSLEPVIDKGKFSVGTTLDLSVFDISEYSFASNNNNVVKVTSDGKVECLKPGSATISATNKDNPSEIYFYDVSVYSILPEIKLTKGSFIEMTEKNSICSYVAKTNTAYKIGLTENSKLVKFVITTESEHIKLGNNGSIIISKAGTYKGYVQVGEDGSPYMYKLPFTIICDDNGVTSQVLYFVRKLFGHFGLFLILSALGTLGIVLYRPKKLYFFIPNLICIYGYVFTISYASEFIQGLNPTRTNSFNDVMINFRGACLGICLVTVIYFIVIGIIHTTKLIIRITKKRLKN